MHHSGQTDSFFCIFTAFLYSLRRLSSVLQKISENHAEILLLFPA